MLRRARRATTRARALSLAGARRHLNVHEYQGAEIMMKNGVRVPIGVACATLDDVDAACDALRGREVVVKSQILAGGRGLGTFASGFAGGVHVVAKTEARATAEKMLGGTLVTKQSGPAGKPVNVLYVAEKLKLTREMYFALMLDRASAGPLVIASAEGGTSIEDLAATQPEKIIKMRLDIVKGMTRPQADELVEKLGVKKHKDDAAKQLLALYDTFAKGDCTMVEVNPLAEDEEGLLVAADAKLNFDDNAEYRQRETFALRDHSQEDAREVQAGKFDLNYIGLDGNIGCMVNGAGLAMATMDIIQLYGGSPANFLDVGGNASEEQVVEAFKILTADPKVKAILVNIFGGIMKCDVIAAGIVAAAKQVDLRVPLIVRLEGTNVEAGNAILSSSDLTIITASDLDDAAQKACASLK
ncbi:Succinyl-CoA synthetase-like [Ostreococcus tauri]|uniref:Succinate--CoA ligase [ADP-forming] subunit beta, mitochondrial n=1 Tax=Ostreococcus tauri TaxID=70448 RepID=A0A090N391_OSTTA|nr:Succinyl-CoA synthetase-like [Ostreococcus tauri]CEF97708.1 Succinyl-CoA synthetase-like [Ostreococcus tauri]|eukprot:XP_003078976.2 Succinyl-CoA synthetase-like [Ostreococcus tauri]